MGLSYLGETTEPAVRQAVSYLLDQQRENGTWPETAVTGTGFPRVFYLKYDFYRNVFPLYALARYRNMQSGGFEFEPLRFSPEEFPPHNGNGHHGNGNGRH